MKIILKQDVKDLGKTGEIRSVKPGFARNYLFPKKLAEEFNDKNNKQWLHLKK